MKVKKNIKNIELNSDRTKSGISLSAPNATLCDIRFTGEKRLNDLVTRIDADLTINQFDKAVIMIVLQYGLRISEVLRLTAASFLKSNKILINSSKGSNNRIVDNFKYYEDLRELSVMTGGIGNVFSRFYYYRLFRRYNVMVELSGSEKKAVTHSGRHLQAYLLESQGVNVEDTKNYIGHKSIKSTEFYVKKKIK